MTQASQESGKPSRRAVAAGIVALPAMLAASAGAAPGAPPQMKGVEVLFDGTAASLAANWEHEDGSKPRWMLVGNAIQSVHANIVSKKLFTNFVLHVEFRVPYMPEAHGQERGNSGVGLQGRYEIQVLDSYGIADPGSGDCGAIYGQFAPLFNACRKPLEWQSYDAVFRAPRYDAGGGMTERARATVFQNGILVQNNQEIEGKTGLDDGRDPREPGPILLQYHGNAVQYRNVWVLPLPEHGALHY